MTEPTITNIDAFDHRGLLMGSAYVSRGVWHVHVIDGKLIFNVDEMASAKQILSENGARRFKESDGLKR